MLTIALLVLILIGVLGLVVRLRPKILVRVKSDSDKLCSKCRTLVREFYLYSDGSRRCSACSKK